MMLFGLLLQPMTAQVKGQHSDGSWQQKVSPLLRQQRSKALSDVRRRAAGGETYLGALVRMTEGMNGEVLRSENVLVLDSLDEFYITLIPASHLESLASKQSVVSVEAHEPGEKCMDVTHVTIGADKVQEGTQPTQIQAFTGKGVVVGISDCGFDYTHPMFRNADGTSAIKKAWDYFTDRKSNGLGGLGAIYTTQEEMMQVGGSRDSITTHATHVMGIAAGRPWKATSADGEVTYRGLAYDADIVATTAYLSMNDEELEKLAEQKVKELKKDADTEEMMNAKIEAAYIVSLLSIKMPFDYAKAQNKPCVVNCSWSHPMSLVEDFTSQDEFLKKLTGPGRILVSGAGNDGDSHIYCEKPEGVTTWSPKVILEKNEATFTFHCDKEFQMNLEVYSENGTTPAYETETATGAKIRNWEETKTNSFYWNYTNKKGEKDPVDITFYSHKNGTDDYSYKVVIHLPSEYFKEEFDELVIKFETQDKMKLMGQANALCFYADSSEKVNLYSNSYTVGWPGISPSAICVGLTSHRNYVRSISGSYTYSSGNKNKEDYIVNWSSCGPTLDGRNKPDVVAPGYNIVSARSKFSLNTEEGRDDKDKVVARAMDGGENREVLMMSGTSMASPVMTGVVALWLQAKPTLTPDDIKQVISRTSKHLDSNMTYPNNTYGYGEVDAYAGLLDILGISTSIPTLSSKQASITLKGHTLYIEGITEPVNVNIYNLSGSLVFSAVATNGTVELPQLPAAVYAVQAGTIGSSLIRL